MDRRSFLKLLGVGAVAAPAVASVAAEGPRPAGKCLHAFEPVSDLRAFDCTRCGQRVTAEPVAELALPPPNPWPETFAADASPGRGFVGTITGIAPSDGAWVSTVHGKALCLARGVRAEHVGLPAMMCEDGVVEPGDCSPHGTCALLR